MYEKWQESELEKKKRKRKETPVFLMGSRRKQEALRYKVIIFNVVMDRRERPAQRGDGSPTQYGKENSGFHALFRRGCVLDNSVWLPQMPSPGRRSGEGSGESQKGYSPSTLKNKGKEKDTYPRREITGKIRTDKIVLILNYSYYFVKNSPVV